ncbi:MAG: hypothetical protein JW928_07545 [Candidatus Aureabacteria bacterium]|nr:hypothetical protein [Candidatus Auribacterota bacterium]
MIRAFLSAVLLFSVLFFCHPAFSEDYFLDMEIIKSTPKEVSIEGQTDLPESTILNSILCKEGRILKGTLRVVQEGSFRFYFNEGLVPGVYTVEIAFSTNNQLEPAVIEAFGGLTGEKIGMIHGMEIKRDKDGFHASVSKEFQIGTQDEIANNRKVYKAYIRDAVEKNIELYLALKKLHLLEKNKIQYYAMPFDEEEWSKKVLALQPKISEIEQIMRDAYPYVVSKEQNASFEMLRDMLFTWVQNLHKLYYLDILNRPLEDAMPMWTHDRKLNLPYVEKTIEDTIADIQKELKFFEEDRTNVEYIYKKGMADIKNIIDNRLKDDPSAETENLYRTKE